MLHLHRSARADGLVGALAALLAEPPADPFAPDVVCVPTRGMERWLSQRLSASLGAGAGRGDGVCANVLFPSPRRLIGDAIAAACGVDPDSDPWLPERAVWPLLEVVEDSLGEPWLALLCAHLGGDGEGGDPVRRSRRFATVRHLAGLYDGYALHRPDVVRGWAGGAGDHWQARLWRRLRERIGQPGPAERLATATARLREDPGAIDLPQRVALFGLTRLPAGERDVLDALAARRDVHLLLLHPSPALWDRLTGIGDVTDRREDPTAALPRNRLLASWGRDAREMQLVLQAGSAERADHHHPVPHADGTLLTRIQAAVRADEAPPGEPLDGRDDARPLLARGDRSVEVHACHGRARQVEVLRDAVLHLLREDPTLEPRDVIVMCPDIETFAPLVHATFGAAAPAEDDEDDALPEDVRPPDLRVRLADRALRQTNPVLGVVAQLLDLAGARVTASQVLDLAGREPVRRRFHLGDDDLARLEEWVTDSGVRWGLDAPSRDAYKLGALDYGTWAFGVRRVLVGVTMTEDERRLVDGVLPLDDVDSGAIALAGRMAELVDRLRSVLADLVVPKPVGAWAASLARAADLLCATAEREGWQRAELQRLLDDLAQEAAEAGTPLALAEVRALLADRLQGRPTRANFRTGHLTFCTLVPMRSVPHRVVCLLGLDDAVFPRKAPRDGDDLRLEDPRIGERDPRAEDRQLLLDAVMAAGERLLITYTGNDERTNAERPPAVPVGELLDVVDRTVRTESGDPARDAVVVRHPLQPFDAKNFRGGELARDAPWSFDRVTLEGACAVVRDRPEPPPFLAAPLDTEPGPVVELDELIDFVAHPVRAFLRGRLGVRLGDLATDVDDALSVALDGLERWQVGDRLLRARLDGSDARSACLAEIARGQLPPGTLGKPVIDAVLPTVEEIVAAAHAVLGDGVAASADVRVQLLDGRTLTGTVTGVRDETLEAVTYSRVGPKHRLAAWVRFLALNAAQPDRPRTAVTIGKAPSGDGVTVKRIAPLAGDPASLRQAALAELDVLVRLFDRALCEPLPLACDTSGVYAMAVADGDRDRADLAARGKWEGGWNWDGEQADARHVMAFGGRRTYDDLRGEPPTEHERGPGWDLEEPSRFGRLAVRLWAPLLEAERRAAE